MIRFDMNKICILYNKNKGIKPMPRFFCDNINGDKITVTGADATHIGRSLRMRVGDELTFCNNGTDYECAIDYITEDEVGCSIVKSFPTESEPTVKVTLYQAMPKQDKLETIIQKTVELGITRIVPFISKRCVSRPSQKEFEKKRDRLYKISESASKQAGRGIIPEIAGLMTFDEAVKDMRDNDIKIICYENEGTKIADLIDNSSKSIGIMIGSEGGFERGEVDKAVENGTVAVWLGKRILRCETCPVAVTAIIMSLTGNM